MAYRSSQQPKFISGIYLNGHNKDNATKNALDPMKVPIRSKGDLVIASAEGNSSDNGESLKFDLVSDNLTNAKYAEMIGLQGKEISNFELFRFIDRWYGTNYRYGGEDEEGIDCSAFAKKLYGDVYGVDLTRTASEQFKGCKRVKRTSDAVEGDLVFFKQKSKRISHVGVYLANDFFVHASSSQGVTISNLNDAYWHKRYAGIGKIAKTE